MAFEYLIVHNQIITADQSPDNNTLLSERAHWQLTVSYGNVPTGNVY